MKRIVYSPSTIVKLPNIFGDGSAGDVTITGTTDLNNDTQYRNLTIAAGGVLRTNGYRVLVQNTLLNNGTIQANGVDAVGQTGGGGVSSGQGGSGTTTLGPGADPAGASNRFIGEGAATGYGGTAGAQAGGDPNASWLMTLYTHQFASVINAYLRSAGSGGESFELGGAPGGGAGGNATGAGAQGGGGGGGGNIMLLCAKQINSVSGVLSSIGGNGGIAQGTGNAGGGGGGSGGVIIIISLTSAIGTVNLTAGTGGAGIGTGAAGAAGNVGTLLSVNGIS